MLLIVAANAHYFRSNKNNDHIYNKLKIKLFIQCYRKTDFDSFPERPYFVQIIAMLQILQNVS